MTKSQAQLELLLLELRENIRRIRMFVRDHELEVPPELEALEKKRDRLMEQVGSRS